MSVYRVDGITRSIRENVNLGKHKHPSIWRPKKALPLCTTGQSSNPHQKHQISRPLPSSLHLTNNNSRKITEHPVTLPYLLSKKQLALDGKEVFWSKSEIKLSICLQTKGTVQWITLKFRQDKAWKNMDYWKKKAKKRKKTSRYDKSRRLVP